MRWKDTQGCSSPGCRGVGAGGRHTQCRMITPHLEKRVSLCNSLGCPRTPCVDQAGLEFTEIHLSAGIKGVQHHLNLREQYNIHNTTRHSVAVAEAGPGPHWSVFLDRFSVLFIEITLEHK